MKIFFGGPTTGKTTAIKKLAASGVRVVDTDRILGELLGVDERRRIKASPGMSLPPIVQVTLDDLLSEDVHDVMITDLVSLIPCADLAVARTRDDVLSISKERDDEFDLAKPQYSWIPRYTPPKAARLIPRGAYLYDLIRHQL